MCRLCKTHKQFCTILWKSDTNRSGSYIADQGSILVESHSYSSQPWTNLNFLPDLESLEFDSPSINKFINLYLKNLYLLVVTLVERKKKRESKRGKSVDHRSRNYNNFASRNGKFLCYSITERIIRKIL